MSVRESLEDSSNEPVDREKKVLTNGKASTSPQGPDTSKKVNEGRICSLCLSWDTCLLLSVDVRDLGLSPLIPGAFALSPVRVLAFLILQLVHGKLWEFSASVIT